MTTRPNGFTDEDFRRLVTLLHRYSAAELDQFDHWRLQTSFGWVFVQLMRELPAGHPEDAYSDISGFVDA